MNKSYLLCCLAIFLVTASSAQIPNWIWAKGGGNSYSNFGRAVATDNAGNVYVTGYFYGPSMTLGNITLQHHSSGYADMFVAKYDSLGNVLWVDSAHGHAVVSNAIGIDALGNVYVTGSIEGTSTFGSYVLIPADTSYKDVFIAKLNASDGSYAWAKRAGGTNHDASNGIAVDSAGNSCIVGTFQSHSIHFGADSLINGGFNVQGFIAAYDASGNVMWARNGKGSQGVQPYAVSIDKAGNVWATGSFNSPDLSFGSDSLSATGTSDMFLVKFDKHGNLLWDRTAGDGAHYSTWGATIATDDNGNAVVGGTFGDSVVHFDTITLTKPYYGYVYFIAKFNADGDAVWAKWAGSYNAMATGVTVAKNGSAILSGYFDSYSITIGSTVLYNNITVGYYEDVFVAKYDSSGNALWAKGFGAERHEYPYGIAANEPGDIYLTGTFTSHNCDIGGTTLSSPDTNGIVVEYFITKLGYGIPTKVETPEQTSNFNISPNPASSSVAVEVSDELLGGEIFCYNLLGELRMQLKVEKPTSKLNCEDLANGIYLLSVKKDDKVSTRKLVIQN